MDFNSVSCNYFYQLADKIIEKNLNQKNISNREERNVKKYKLRVYKISGKDKGKIDHEEFFQKKEEMDERYLYFLSYRIGWDPLPTAWKMVDGEWKRLEGY